MGIVNFSKEIHMEVSHLKPTKGFLKRWSMIWAIPVIISGGTSFYYHSLAQDNREAIAFHEAESTRLESAEPERLSCDSSRAEIPDGYKCKEGPYEDDDAGLAWLKERYGHLSASIENEESLSYNERSHRDYFDIFAALSAIFLAPFVIWLLLVMGRWVWRGNE
jgi:hypothetical protein